MDKCPSCGSDSIFTQFGPWVDYQGRPHFGGRVEAFCNGIQCDQRFWWYPATQRITRRNTGLTWNERRERHGCHREHVDEIRATVAVGEAGPGRLHLPMLGVYEEESSRSGWRETAMGWVYWLRGSIRLMLPGGGEKPA